MEIASECMEELKMDEILRNVMKASYEWHNQIMIEFAAFGQSIISAFGDVSDINNIGSNAGLNSFEICTGFDDS